MPLQGSDCAERFVQDGNCKTTRVQKRQARQNSNKALQFDNQMEHPSCFWPASLDLCLLSLLFN